jgi:protein translocase SecG subunit
MKEIISISQIFVSFILIILILIQQRGSAFSFSQPYFKRRGTEKIIFFLTMFFFFLFIILALANLLI